MMREWFSKWLPGPVGVMGTFALWLCLAQPSLAQLPVTNLTTIFPPGGKQGSTTDVTLGGANQDQLTQLLFSHTGITAKQKTSAPSEFEAPRAVNNVFEVTIDAKVPPGVYEVRAVGRFGASNPRAFVVGTLNEVIDNGSNRTPETAQALEVGSSVNGRCEASNRDYYKVSLKSGQRVIVDCWAHRIDSRLNGTLIVLSPAGRELARSRDAVGLDPVIDFQAPTDGDYLIGLYDFVYGGGAEHAYRLNVHQGPHVDFIFPPAGLPGSNENYTVYGRNLPGGKPAKEMLLNGRPLEMVEAKIQLPGDPLVSERLPVPLPRTTAVTGIAYRHGSAQPVHVGIARGPVVREQEPNNSPDTATKLQLPCDCAGQFYPARDADWYQFDAKQGDVFWIEVLSHQLGLESDPYLVVQRVTKNDKGEESVSDVAQADDPSDRNGRIGSDFDTSTDDPAYRFQCPGDGTYRVMVRDQFGGGASDPRNVYRLIIRPETPDFRLAALPKQIKVANNNQVLQFSPVLRRGGTTLVNVIVSRLHGFQGEIELMVEGLPEGVRCDGAIIDAKTNNAWLVLAAAADAKPWTGPVSIVGKAKIGDQVATRKAAGGTVVWGTTNRTQIAPMFRATSDVVVSVVDKDPGVALIEVGDGKLLETSRGGKLELPLKVVRAADFKDALKLVATGMPAEIKPADVTIAKDKNDGKLTIQIANAKAKAGVYTFFLRGDSKVKRALNPDAIKRVEGRQKKLQDAVKTTGDAVKQATTVQAAANKTAQTSATATKAAEAAQKAKKAAVDQAAVATRQATGKLTTAQTAAQKAPENQALKAAVDAAQKAVDEATAKQQAAEEALAAAEKALAESEKKSQADTAAKTKADQALTELQGKGKRATAAKAAIDKELATVKKANAAKDFNFAVASLPIRLRVVDTPVQLTAPESVAVKQAEKAEIAVTLARNYGFADAVEVTLEVPKGVTGLSAAKLPVAKDAADGKLMLTAAKNATPGNHTVTLRAKFKFNKVSLDASTQTVIKVEKVEPPKK